LPPAPEIATRVERGLRQIRPALIKQALIYGQRPGDLVPQWSETIQLVTPAPQPVPRSQSTQPTFQFESGKLMAWGFGLLACLIIPVFNFIALLAFILGFAPFALQQGTVIASGGRWRLSYGSALGNYLIVSILTGIAYLIASIFGSLALQLGVLILAEFIFYLWFINVPGAFREEGAWIIAKAVLFMNLVTVIPLIIAILLIHAFAIALLIPGM
jgi:hypothetical protein